MKELKYEMISLVVPFLILVTASVVEGKSIEPTSTTTGLSGECQNGGTWLSGEQIQGCVCPAKYYGKYCQNKMCRQYVKLKSPATALYKSLSSIEGGHTRFRLTYRTRYSNTVKCFEDI